MKATEQLHAEHEGITSILETLEKILEEMSSGEAANLDHLGEIVDFLRVFADHCHHGKEGDILFPAVEKQGIPREGGSIGVMLEDHGHGRGIYPSSCNGSCLFQTFWHAGRREPFTRSLGDAEQQFLPRDVIAEEDPNMIDSNDSARNEALDKHRSQYSAQFETVPQWNTFSWSGDFTRMTFQAPPILTYFCAI